MTVDAPILSLRDVTQLFWSRSPDGWRRRALRALDGVSLDVHEGETLAIVGESGSGKSTLARLLLALNRPSSGQVCFRGTDLRRLGAAGHADYRRSVQAVFQDPSSSLNPRMRVSETLGYVVRRHDLATAQRQAAFIEGHLASVGLTPADSFMGRYPSQLSGGQQQRVAIARAMMLAPRVIVADEPLSALDVSIQGQVLELMRALKERSRVGFVVISHDLHAMEAIADRVAVMHQGRIVEMGRDVFTHPKHEYTRLLLRARLPADPRAARAQLAAAVAGPVAVD
ncbi:MAG: ABC transporter ATP-binding protein [Rubrivivax sp.]|nr:ABC transporter ATP-binding protein [Rubrivivax sp.]MCL4697010.1 ATP-binding cassette domain-containing protein [Burkholderiaceae bacterium]NUP86723.1 ABC transporter ATP-binding protein [Burkholderiaceae bacterium]